MDFNFTHFNLRLTSDPDAFFGSTTMPPLSSFYSHLPRQHQHQQLCCYSDPKWKLHNSFVFLKDKCPCPPRRTNSAYYWILKSVLNGTTSTSVADNGGETEPPTLLLERLFPQTQMLEQQIGGHLSSPTANLGKLDSDLHAALSALKNKEEHLRDVERNVLSEYKEINRAKEDLRQRETDIMSATLKQEKLQEELRLANIDLASQAREIGDLKLRLEEQDGVILDTQSMLAVKEVEIHKMKQDLVKRNEEAANAESELKLKAELLEETNKVVEKQRAELDQLQRAIREKEEELNASLSVQKMESEKLKVAETALEKQTMHWLLAQEELENLKGEETSKLIGELNDTQEEFERVKKLLSDVRSELVTNQSALASTRKIIESQDELLEKQSRELEEQRISVTSYMTSLKNAELELENERAKLRLSQAQNKVLERDLSMEKELVCELQKGVEKERLSLKQAIEETLTLRDEIEHKSAAYEQTRTILEGKESELVEARVEIQNLKSEQASLQLILEEKDLELSKAKSMLEEVNQEMVNLKAILLSREDELIQATSLLKEKDEHVETMLQELSHEKLKSSEAETVVEKIVDLTKRLVLTYNDEDNLLNPLLDSNFDDGFKWQLKQLEAELEFTRESLRAKEMEILAAQKALAAKDEELKIVLQKLDSGEKQIAQVKGDIGWDEDQKHLSALSQVSISSDEDVVDLAIEKLQLGAAQMEAEAATTALHKIVDMSRQLLKKANLSIEADYESYLAQDNGSGVMDDSECSGEVKSEISRLLALTEKLVKESGIACDMNQVQDR